MKLVICSIRDAKAEAFVNPMVFQSNGEALRTFMDAVNSADHPMGKHPEDYSLFVLGEFDQRSGEIAIDVPFCLANGMNLQTGE